LESGRYNQWIFTWNDFLENTIKDKDEIGVKQDEQFIKDKFFGRHATFKGYKIEDFYVSNNVSRFLHLIINPITVIDIKKWSSLILFNCQTKMMGVIYDPDEVEEIITNRSIKNAKTTTLDLNNYIHASSVALLDEAILEAFIRPKDFEVKAFGSYMLVPSWQKENWAKFWRVYNLLQFHNVTVASDSKDEEESGKESDILNEEILQNFDKELHSIVKDLIENNIEFNSEFDFDLVKDDVIVASAELGSKTNKFVVNPFDKESEETFINEGYQIFTPNNFKID